MLFKNKIEYTKELFVEIYRTEMKKVLLVLRQQRIPWLLLRLLRLQLQEKMLSTEVRLQKNSIHWIQASISMPHP